MIPVLSHIVDHEGLSIAVTTDGACSLSLELIPCDPEVDDVEGFHKRLIQVVRQLDPSVICRVELISKDCSDLSSEFPRAKTVNEIGFVRNEVRIYLDVMPGFGRIFRKGNAFGRAEAFELLVETKSLFENLGFKLSPIEATSAFRSADLSALCLSGRSIETDSESIGVVRLLKQPDREFDYQDLFKALTGVSKPYRVTLSFSRMSEARAKVMLERKLKQLEGAKNIAAQVQTKSTVEALKQSFESGTQYFEIELLLTLTRDSQSELSKDLRTSQSALSLFSESYIETFGVLPSFAATLPGSKLHVPLIEAENALVAMLPMYFPRSANISLELDHIAPKRSLTLQRADQSLFHFDIFNTQHNVFNALIVGTSGKGKSVLTGLLTSSLLNDPNVHVIKVDVAGSHSKECELYGGTEYNLSFDKPSGINPLAVISTNASTSEKIALVANFLICLILENNEYSISKEMRSSIEDEVRKYIELEPANPNLQDFYDHATNFPRRTLLRRWVKGGVYAMAFSRSDEAAAAAESEAAFTAHGHSVESQGLETEVAAFTAHDPRRMDDQGEGIEPDKLVQFPTSGHAFSAPPRELFQLPRLPPLQHCPRLRYYNFKSIFQAADPEFAVAGFAAVLTDFKTQTLVDDSRRFALVLEEVPFFVKSCFELIKFVCANDRKLGHAVIPISQRLSDLIVNNDLGIIQNSPQRFLFNADAESLEETSAFKRSLGLSDQQMKDLDELMSVPGKFSEVALQTEEGVRKLTIKLSEEEYWERTSSKTDKEKMRRLMEFVPGLTTREAIAVLSI